MSAPAPAPRPTSVRPPLLSSLRWRLSASISGVVLICAAVCIAGAVVFLNQTLTDRATADLQRTLAGVSGYLRDQRSDLLGEARLIATDPAVGAALRARNRQALVVRLTPLYADLNTDVIDVIDARGRVLVRMEDPQSYGDDVGGRPSTARALRGDEVVAFESDLARREAAGGYALRATVPVRDGARVSGAVVVGRQLDSIYASRIAHALSANINLIAGNERTGSSLTDSHGLPVVGLPEPASVLRRIAQGHPIIARVQEDGRAALSGLVRLFDAAGRPVGAVEVISPLGPLYDLITQLSFILLALGAGVVVIGTMLALGAGRRLTARLLALEATAARVAAMAAAEAPFGSLHSVVEVRGDDEVASLARSFRAMMLSLEDRMEANVQLYQAAQARVRELTGLAEIARLLTARLSVEETLDKLGEQVSRLVGCTAVAIVLPDAGAQTVRSGGYGLPADYAALAAGAVIGAPTAPAAPLASRAALASGRVAWSRLDELPEQYAALRERARELGWGAATAVPLRVQGRTVGTMICYTTAAVPLSTPDLSLLNTIADQVAVAVENARLYARARDLAALEERARLARELHDSVTQALFSITLHIRAVQLGVERAGLDAEGTLARSVRQLNDLTQGALAEMRALIFELRPNALAEEGLSAALRKQAAALRARVDLNVEVKAPPERLDLEPEVEENLYRLALEALNNVVKHASASHVWVRVRQAGSDVSVEIQDDGVGFDPSIERPGHLGLGTMAERARQVGGELQITSAPGQGTTVRVEVPGAVVEHGEVAMRGRVGNVTGGSA